MKRWPKIINKIEEFFIFSLPLAVFFSYFPVINLGDNDTMHLELSVPLIWLGILGLLALRKVPEIIKQAPRKALLLSASLPIYTSLSLLWSGNKLRGLLTSAIVWLIFLFAWRIACERKTKKNNYKKLIDIYLKSAVVFAVVCILQCFLDVWGVKREITQLCTGCTYQSFGFPHPNGFAIEPQFMGNLLLAPCILSVFILYETIKNNKSNKKKWQAGLLCFFLIMSLYIVFSRGATYAFALAMLVFVGYKLYKDGFKQIKYIIICGICAVIGALGLQGIWAHISPTDENAIDGIARSIHQMSLGLIDIRPTYPDLSDAQTFAPVEEPEESDFDGYIPESTNIRLEMSEVALDTWTDHKLLGAGIGGAGVAMNEKHGEAYLKEIVQNEPIMILLELGLVGSLLVIANLIYFLVPLFKRFNLLGLLILLAYAVSMMFFSGLPNALHIYLLSLPIILGQQRFKVFCN